MVHLATVLPLCIPAVALGACRPGEEARPWRDAALEAARWIRSTQVPGAAWPADAADPASTGTSLYSGSTGVVLFFLQLARCTGDPAYLEDARGGADFLLASLEVEEENGLYVGLGGIGFALLETFAATGEERYRDGARRCVQLLGERAREVGRGVEWSEVTDVVSGGAGTGLFLIHAARKLEDPGALELAARAGERLLELALPAEGGLQWEMAPGFERRMPNFSHGTAGVAYFLASLYLETRHGPFLDAAVAGARALQAEARGGDAGFLVAHHRPGGEELFYLGWCHGPVGTTRLFYRLFQATGDPEWRAWVERGARSILESGIPEHETPGFWNNPGQCCGSAGVAEFFLDVHQIAGDRAYRHFAERVARDLLARSKLDARGRSWPGAEHRVQPERITEQTGYMQGAAGVGILLLALDAGENDGCPRLRLPDSPYP